MISRDSMADADGSHCAGEKHVGGGGRRRPPGSWNSARGQMTARRALGARG